MKLTLIDISWSETSPVSFDGKVATYLGLETLEYRLLFTVSTWRYSKISYSRIMMDNASRDEKILPCPLVKRSHSSKK